MSKTADHEFDLIPDGTDPWGERDRENWELLDRKLQYVYANVYTVDNEEVTVIETQDVPVRVNYGQADVLQLNGNLDLSADGLTYTGQTTRLLTVVVTAAVESVGNNQRYLFTARVNDVVVPQVRGRARIGSGGDVVNVTAIGIVEMAAGDVFTVWVQNETSDGNLIVVDGSLVVKG